MALEIERKYLVVNDKWKPFVEHEARLKQGYLAALPGITVRVRMVDEQALLTIKGETTGISRLEYEYAIPLSDAREMLERLVADGAIDKTRYRVRCGEHVWDLDRFHGDNEGLILAEIELQSEREAFQLPDWVGEEVSRDPRYYNANLIKRPYRGW
jgi:adenylate cyclase